MLTDTNISEISQLLFSTFSVLKEKVKSKGQEEKCEDISFLQIRTLQFILEKDEPTMKDVAEFLAITPPSATSLVEHFAKHGQIERILDKEDRRIVRLAITAKGKNILQERYRFMVDIFKDILSGLSNEQIKEFKIILETLSRK